MIVNPNPFVKRVATGPTLPEPGPRRVDDTDLVEPAVRSLRDQGFHFERLKWGLFVDKWVEAAPSQVVHLVEQEKVDKLRVYDPDSQPRKIHDAGDILELDAFEGRRDQNGVANPLLAGVLMYLED